MSTLYDGNGNAISVGSGKDVAKTALTNADIIAFGDSNVYYSYGHALTDIGSFFYRFWNEFGINTLVNNGSNGAQTCNMWVAFKNWFTAERITQYNKTSTILIFHCGTNDHYYQVTSTEDYVIDFNNTSNWNDVNNTPWAIAYISQFISHYLPKAKYLWVIPMATDWSKWTGSQAADDRNMDEKYPYYISNLEKWHIPHIDAYNQSGITTEMLSDGIHLGGGGTDYTTISVEKYYRFIREKLVNM